MSARVQAHVASARHESPAFDGVRTSGVPVCAHSIAGAAVDDLAAASTPVHRARGRARLQAKPRVFKSTRANVLDPTSRSFVTEGIAGVGIAVWPCAMGRCRALPVSFLGDPERVARLSEPADDETTNGGM